MDFLSEIALPGIISKETLLLLAEAAAIALFGYLSVRLLAVIMRRTVTRNSSDQVKSVVHKTIVYAGSVFIIIAVLGVLGVKLSALLGAAGVVGIAVGIASQKSLGNIISGLFLVSDKTFEVGDVVKVGSTTGVVHSLDLMSMKLRTFDNLLIRIPNDTILTSEITNITRFPIRRMDFHLMVGYKEHLPRVKEILLQLAQDNPLCLDDPEPFFLYQDFADSGIKLMFSVWFEKNNFVAVKNSVFEEIRARFAAEGIEIPFPHISLYAGAKTDPFPIRQFSDYNR